MGLPHDGTNGTLPSKFVKSLKERVLGKRSVLGQTPVFRAHSLNDCFMFGCLASQVVTIMLRKWVLDLRIGVIKSTSLGWGLGQ